jgi:hypothetical protein
MRKKKSIFWELDYWKVLEVRSAIDVMHVTKNLCVNLLGFLGMYGNTKDTQEARQNKQHVKDPEGRHPEWFHGRASYALTKEEKNIFYECLNSINVPSGFSSNIKGIINMSEKKFQNLKSHDCHVIKSPSFGALRVVHQQLSPGCPVMDYPSRSLPASSSSEQLELSKEEPQWWLSSAYHHH